MNAFWLRHTAAASIVFLAACASGSSVPSTPPQRVLAISDQGTLRADEGVAADSVIEAAPEAAFAALQSAYKDLGIEIKVLDPGTHTIGSNRFSRMYQLDGVQLSKYVGCGTTPTGLAADSYRVTMQLTSRVRPSTSGSRVETQLTAYAEDLASSTGKISCITRGALEQRIHALAVKHISG